MRKQEYMEAFSQVHAPQALKEQLLQPKLRPNYTRKFAVLAACAVVASLLGIVLMGSATDAPPKTTDISIDWNKSCIVCCAKFCNRWCWCTCYDKCCINFAVFQSICTLVKVLILRINDERNKFIRNKAWAFSGYFFIIIAGICLIVFKIIVYKF